MVMVNQSTQTARAAQSQVSSALKRRAFVDRRTKDGDVTMTILLEQRKREDQARLTKRN
jgi:hypothetical protein